MPRTAWTAARSSSSWTSSDGAHQPAAGGDAAPGLDLDVAQLAADLGRDVALAVLLREGERPCRTAAPSSSRPRTACTSATPSVASTRASSPGSPTARASPQAWRRQASPGSTAPASIAARPASSWPSAAARSPTAPCPSTSPASRARATRGSGARPSSRRNRTSQAAACSCAAARSPETAEAADEQLVGALVELVVRERARGEGRAVERPARGERRVGGVVEERLARAREPAALDQQPGLEHRPRVGLDPLEQLAAGERGVGVVPGDRVDVDVGARRETERQRVARERLGRAERAAQLGERPAQRAQRVLGAAERELGEAGARDRPVGQREVGEHRPGLAAAGRGRRRAVAEDLRRPEQADLEAVGCHRTTLFVRVR